MSSTIENNEMPTIDIECPKKLGIYGELYPRNKPYN